jgi:hypothetical protein
MSAIWESKPKPDYQDTTTLRTLKGVCRGAKSCQYD